MNLTLHRNSTTSRTEDLIKQVRKMPLFRQLIPLEAGIGFPLPTRKENKVYITLPFFGMGSTAKPGETPLYPPLAIASIDWSNQIPVEYANLRFRHPSPELDWTERVGTFPHPEVAQMSVGEYRQLRQELLSMYDEMFDRLTDRQLLSSEWSQRFTKLLNLLIEPALKPYYHALNPKFGDRFLIESL